MPGTVVSFHAHPDDEAILVGGTLALAADAGHRIVLVFATRGDLGEVADGVLAPDEALADRREVEAARAPPTCWASARVEFLPYRDSGMAGEPTNDRPGAFTGADVDEAASLLAEILREEQAAVSPPTTTTAGTGTPTTSRCTTSGVRAAELARHATRLRGDGQSRALPRPGGPDAGRACPTGSTPPTPRRSTSACPTASITTRIDVTPCSTASGRRWPRTRARSPATRSSSRSTTKRSDGPSAPSGSSASTTATPRPRPGLL